MRNLFSFFQKNTVVTDESTALLNAQYDPIVISSSESTVVTDESTALLNAQHEPIKLKHFFTDIEDGNIDQLILQYFAENLRDYCAFGLVSKSLSTISKKYIPLPLPVIKNIFSNPKESLTVRQGFTTAQFQPACKFTTKKIKKARNVDTHLIQTIKACVDELDFKMKITDFFPGEFSSIFGFSFFCTLLLTFFYLSVLAVILFKSPSDIFNCNTLLPDAMTQQISIDSLSEAASWITQNNLNINATNQLVAFCNTAHRIYCNNHFTAVTNKEGVFDPYLGANVTCSDVPGFAFSTLTLLGMNLFIITARLLYVLNKWPVLSKNEMVDQVEEGVSVSLHSSSQ